MTLEISSGLNMLAFLWGIDEFAKVFTAPLGPILKLFC